MEPSLFQAFKLVVVQAAGLSRDALHVHVGLSVFLLAALLLRNRKWSWLPLAAALAAAVFGELLDMRDDIATRGAWRVGASLHDIANTAFWPCVLTLWFRFVQRPPGASIRSGPTND